MKDVLFPARLLPEENGFMVSFPDIPGCLTDGNTYKEACDMAQDAANLMLAYMESL